MRGFTQRLARTLLILVAGTVTVGACAGGADAAKRTGDLPSIGEIELDYEKFTLENGLTVLMHTDKRYPSVFVNMTYLVGSKDEPEGKTGFAHLYEHLMFKGTENRDGDYFKPLQEAGAFVMNGTTDRDRTNFFAAMPSEALDLALWLESDRMMYLTSTIDEQILADEREVVKNEKRQHEDPWYGKTEQPTNEGIYPQGHPYRHSVIGSMEDLNSASLEDVRDWFRKYYGASNAVLVLSGNVDLDTAREKVTKYFAAVPAGEPLKKQGQWIPQFAANKLETLYLHAPQPVVMRHWVLPRSVDKDTTLMSLVGASLANNDNSPLKKRLIDELKLATSVRARVMPGIVSSEFYLEVEVIDGVDPEEVRRAIDDTLAQYLQAGPDEAILKAAKLRDWMMLVDGLDDPINAGFTLAETYVQAGDPSHFQTELSWIDVATPQEVGAIAERWLSKPYFELTVMPFPEYASATQDADRSSVPEVVMEPSDVEFPETETVELDNGATLVVAEYGDKPIESFEIVFNGGNYAQPGDALGSGELLAELLTKGTRRYSADAFATELDSIAMDPEVHVHEQYGHVQYRILGSNLDRSLELAVDMLANAALTQDEIDKARTRVRSYLESMESEPEIEPLFNRAIYGAGSPAGRVLAINDVAGLSRKDLLAFHQRVISPENLTIYAVGGVDAGTVKRAVNQTFGKWRGSGAPVPEPTVAALPPKPRILLVDKPDAVQSNIMAGHAWPAFDAKQQAMREAANAILGGHFLARLNMNLRVEKGWSYGVNSFIGPNPSGDQYIAVAGSVQTDKTKESMVEIVRELREYVSKRPATPEELEEYKISMIRSIPGTYTNRDSFLQSMQHSALYGLPYDHDGKSISRVEAVALDDVNATARALIRPDKLTWVIVGDLDEIEEDVRSLGYGEVEVWDPFGNRLR